MDNDTKEEVKSIIMSEDEFRNEVIKIVFDQPMFTLRDLMQMGVVGTRSLKKLFNYDERASNK